MNRCPVCGNQRQGETKKCPKCNVFYSQIDEFLAEEEEQEERDLIKTRLKRVLAATDHKHALQVEWQAFKQTLPKGTGFVMYVILAFVFAMIVVVI